jgi:hypothetical protein
MLLLVGSVLPSLIPSMSGSFRIERRSLGKVSMKVCAGIFQLQQSKI